MKSTSYFAVKLPISTLQDMEESGIDFEEYRRYMGRG